jgi:hypothetical protein
LSVKNRAQLPINKKLTPDVWGEAWLSFLIRLLDCHCSLGHGFDSAYLVPLSFEESQVPSILISKPGPIDFKRRRWKAEKEKKMEKPKHSEMEKRVYWTLQLQEEKVLSYNCITESVELRPKKSKKMSCLVQRSKFKVAFQQ